MAALKLSSGLLLVFIRVLNALINFGSSISLLIDRRTSNFLKHFMIKLRRWSLLASGDLSAEKMPKEFHNCFTMKCSSAILFRFSKSLRRLLWLEGRLHQNTDTFFGDLFVERDEASNDLAE